MHSGAHRLTNIRSQTSTLQATPRATDSTAMSTRIAHTHRPRLPTRGHRRAQEGGEARPALKLRSVSPSHAWPGAEPQQLWEDKLGQGHRTTGGREGRGRPGVRWEAVPAQAQFCSPHSHRTQAQALITHTDMPPKTTLSPQLPSLPRSPSHSLMAQETR